MSDKSLKINWQPIQNSLQQGTVSGYKIAILEMNKIFYTFLENKKYSAKTEEKQFEKIYSIISKPEKLIYAQTMYKKIIKEHGFDIGKQDTEDIIKSYYLAMVDIFRDLHEKETWKTNLLNKFKYYYPKPLKFLKIAGIICAIFIVLVLFLADTSIGQGITQAIISFIHFILFKLLIIIGVLGAIGLTIFGIIILIKHKKEN
ncbi:hypothetical protein CL633_03800 [bacterium]|nr:hypothetical protein [bacterium]|tara:strand:- start:365 stop:970 length:606 start_codon:yes stop_codon:yes gene_type:complete